MQSEKMGHQNITKEMKYTIVDELYRSIRNHNHKNTKIILEEECYGTDVKTDKHNHPIVYGINHQNTWSGC